MVSFKPIRIAKAKNARGKGTKYAFVIHLSQI